LKIILIEHSLKENKKYRIEKRLARYAEKQQQSRNIFFKNFFS